MNLEVDNSLTFTKAELGVIQRVQAAWKVNRKVDDETFKQILEEFDQIFIWNSSQSSVAADRDWAHHLQGDVVKTLDECLEQMS